MLQKLLPFFKMGTQLVSIKITCKTFFPEHYINPLSAKFLKIHLEMEWVDLSQLL